MSDDPRGGPEGDRALPYARHSLDASDRDAVLRCLDSGRLAQGHEVVAFEEGLAERVGRMYAVAVSSGTAALQVALRALGVVPGDEVIVPSLTFVATANAVALCGATPVFADIDPHSLTLDPTWVAKLAGPRTRGVVPMHYAGQAADVDAIREAAGSGRFVLEDACHGLGGSVEGRSIGGLGDAACFSFHPAKHITTGEGGAVATDDPQVARRLFRLREHGIERDAQDFEGLGLPRELAHEASGDWIYEMHTLAANFRLAECSAALGRSQLARLDRFLERRAEVAESYEEALCDLDALELPEEGPAHRSAWHLYAVRVRPGSLRGGRAALFARLRSDGIGVQVHYVPVHLQPWYRRRLGTGWGDLPATENAYLGLVSLPLFADIRDADVGRVVESVRRHVRELRR